MSQSALYAGKVMHQRLRPMRHRLRYGVFSLLLDLDELPGLARRLKLFSLNRFNLLSLHERDYGASEEPGQGLRPHVERQLAAAGLAAGGAIRLLTMPRILGYAFNPLSVYFCHHPAGPLQAILYEVNNTFGQRHSYLIEVDAAAEPGTRIEQHCAKQFYVSPFLGLQMDYSFRVDPPSDALPGLRLDITAGDAQGALLVARLDASRKPLTDAGLALALLAHPLLTLKVIAAIHWEALRLWIKGARLHTRPPLPAEPVTIITTRDT